uniref:Outer dense fiber protein 2 n=1 Tax=Sinocyclocheilus anshuiensis TaxID=1608454 RepID=A0A671QQV9_9TELE
TRTSSSSPPLHVHVNETTTPVHVHVKKSTKCSPTKTGPSHRLEITPPQEPECSQSPLRIEDLSTDEEEALHGRINQYERKIDSLMTEVSSLKNERQSERLSATQRVIAEQEEELAEVARELEATEQENSRLRESMEKMLEGNDFRRLERDSLQPDKDVLLRKLLEAEMDSSAAAKQVSALRETEKKMSGSDSTLLTRQKELLLQKLETFESTNRALRHLLREQHNREMESLRLLEQKDVLLKKLSDVEHILVKLQDKDKEINQLTSLLESEKDSAKTTTELSKVLESTRAHLQGQLRNKEAENNRLNVQIRNLERSISQQQGEVEHLQNQLRDLRQQAEADKEALKKATRAQKQRTQRSEDTVGQLSAQLLEIVKHLFFLGFILSSVVNRKLEEANSQNRDLIQVISKREETIHSNQVRLEEKSRECSILTRQLEEALGDARRQVTQTRERAASKERVTQSKIVDLETQLSRTTTELNQLRRAKEEAERRYQSRLQDVKDRLEQSDSTNRSLQNYVQFLKSSYVNVFGDPALTGSSFHTPSPI